MENKDPRMHRKTIDGITAFEEENVQDSNPFAPLKPLDEALLKARIQTLFEERNAHLKKLLEDLSSTVTEIVNMLQQLTTVHDELILDAYNSEIQCIQQMEVSQERMNNQIVRFIDATSASFAEIFQEPSSP